METIITVSSIMTMIISAFMLVDIAYNKIKYNYLNSEGLVKYATLFTTGYLFYKLPNHLGFIVLMFLLLFLFLVRMIFLTNKLSKQTN